MIFPDEYKILRINSAFTLEEPQGTSYILGKFLFAFGKPMNEMNIVNKFYNHLFQR